MILLMKKLLGIIIILLIFSSPSFSEIYEMNQCYHKGDETIWKSERWDIVSKTKKKIIDPDTYEIITTNEMVERTEDSIISIDTVIGKLFETDIESDYSISYSKLKAKWYRNSVSGKKKKKESEKKWIADGQTAKLKQTHEEFWEGFLRRLEKPEKIIQTEYDLLTITGDLVIGQKISNDFEHLNISKKTKIYVNLKKKTYTRVELLNGENIYEIQYICNSQNTSSGENTGGSSGTAFFISNRGHLLTNNHVIEGCSLSKITYKNNDYDAKLLATDKTLDLALLKADLKPKSFFTFSKDETKKLSKIYVAGYPLGKGLSDDLKIASGIVSSLKGFKDNSNEIQIDAPINPGNSGGPIINENGDLIAIAVSGLAKDQTEGINFGIKSSAAETFLKTNKINPKKSMYSGIKDNDKLLEILEEGTVYTYCN
jgi:S1-C subfamily serine protease